MTSTPFELTAGPICSDPSMVRVFSLAARAARWNLSVLITGETGVGKEVVAQEIHRLSNRQDRPLIVVNCAALSPQLLESELFGHEKGAFTGATAAKAGLFEACDGGSLFLDEIGEMPRPAQAKLLRVLEAREVLPVGSTRPRAVDVRVIAATNRDLSREIATGSFRADLFHRLNGLPIAIPPLRERRGEIRQLAQLFLERTLQGSSRIIAIVDETIRRLERHDWPGNVRELRSAIERAALLCDGPDILPEHLLLPEVEPSIADHDGHSDRERIMNALVACAGNQTRAAELMGMSRRTFVNRLDQFGIPRPQKASSAVRAAS